MNIKTNNKQEHQLPTSDIRLPSSDFKLKKHTSMKRFIYLFATIALLSAFTGKQQNNTSDANSEENQLVEQTASDEDFDTFFDKFKADSVFQKSRIQFPLQSKSYDEKEITVEQIAEKDWRYNNFHWDSSYEYTQQIIVEGDKSTLQYSGIENGINIQSIFERKHGKWYFTAIEDRSM